MNRKYKYSDFQEVSERYIVNREIDSLFWFEEVSIDNDSKTHILNLFFKAIGNESQNITYAELMHKYSLLIRTPFIVSITYARVHNLSVDIMVKKTIVNIQARIKEAIMAEKHAAPSPHTKNQE